MKTADEIIDKLDEKYGEDNYSILDVVNFTMKELRPQWIKIESEDDLPKDTADCFFYDSLELAVFCGMYNADFKKIVFSSLIIKWDKHITHYMPIIKPEPPKED